MASVSPLRQAGGQAFVNAGQLQKSMVTNLIYSVAASKNFCNQRVFLKEQSTCCTHCL
jgi:hypothetical protein